MAKTNAEYQQEHRQRRAERLTRLESQVASLRHQLGITRGDLETAHAEIGRLEAELSAGPASRCPHCRGELACPRCYRADGF